MDDAAIAVERCIRRTVLGDPRHENARLRAGELAGAYPPDRSQRSIGLLQQGTKPDELRCVRRKANRCHAAASERFVQRSVRVQPQKRELGGKRKKDARPRASNAGLAGRHEFAVRLNRQSLDPVRAAGVDGGFAPAAERGIEGSVGIQSRECEIAVLHVSWSPGVPCHHQLAVRLQQQCQCAVGITEVVDLNGSIAASEARIATAVRVEPHDEHVDLFERLTRGTGDYELAVWLLDGGQRVGRAEPERQPTVAVKAGIVARSVRCAGQHERNATRPDCSQPSIHRERPQFSDPKNSAPMPIRLAAHALPGH